MLEIRSLTKRYNGIAAVENISFRIDPGEIVGYLGPNGSGKSTIVTSSYSHEQFMGICIR